MDESSVAGPSRISLSPKRIRMDEENQRPIGARPLSPQRASPWSPEGSLGPRLYALSSPLATERCEPLLIQSPAATKSATPLAPAKRQRSRSEEVNGESESCALPRRQVLGPLDAQVLRPTPASSVPTSASERAWYPSPGSPPPAQTASQQLRRSARSVQKPRQRVISLVERAQAAERRALREAAKAQDTTPSPSKQTSAAVVKPIEPPLGAARSPRVSAKRKSTEERSDSDNSSAHTASQSKRRVSARLSDVSQKPSSRPLSAIATSESAILAPNAAEAQLRSPKTLRETATSIDCVRNAKVDAEQHAQPTSSPLSSLDGASTPRGDPLASDDSYLQPQAPLHTAEAARLSEPPSEQEGRISQNAEGKSPEWRPPDEEAIVAPSVPLEDAKTGGPSMVPVPDPPHNTSSGEALLLQQYLPPSIGHQDSQGPQPHLQDRQQHTTIQTENSTPTTSTAFNDPAPLILSDTGPPPPPYVTSEHFDDSVNLPSSDRPHATRTASASPAATPKNLPYCSPTVGGLLPTPNSSLNPGEHAAAPNDEILEELHVIADELSQKSAWEKEEVIQSDAHPPSPNVRQSEMHAPPSAITAFPGSTTIRPCLSATDSEIRNLFQDSITETQETHSQGLGLVGASMAPVGTQSCAFIQQSFFPEAQNPYETLPDVFQPAQQCQDQREETCAIAEPPREQKLASPVLPALEAESRQTTGDEDREAAVSTQQPSQERLKSQEPLQLVDPSAGEAAASSRQQETQSLFAEFDSIDFDGVDLTPRAHQQDASMDRPQTQESPLASRARTRTFTRHPTKDSFDDLACDSVFWEEAFDCQDGLPEGGDANATTGNDDASADEQDFGMPLQAPPPGAFLGFQTAANRKIAPPSEDAMAKARRRFEELSGPEIPVRMTADAHAGKTKPPDRIRPFSVARPLELAPRHKSRMDEDDASSSGEAPSPTSSGPTEPIPQFVSFQKASGGSVNLSKSALEAARRRMAMWDAEPHSDEVKAPAMRPSATLVSSAAPLLISDVQNLPSATRNGLDQQDIDEEASKDGRPNGDVSASPKPKMVVVPEVLGSHRPQTPSAPAPRPMAATNASTAVAAFATPVRPTADRPALSAAHSVGPRPNGTPRPSLIGRTSRISLGMTPRAKAAASGKAFKTPFKNGGRPMPQPQGVSSHSSPDIFRYSNSIANTSTKTEARKELLLPSKASPAVFDLKAQAPRLSMRQFGMEPRKPVKSSAVDELSEIPIILQNPKQASRFVFDSPAGNPLGPAEVLEELKRCGASLVDIDWVKNHWVLILWKLAAYANCRPDQSEIWWSFEQVCRQIKYRYEREINLAQRSPIKRIQEHDSPASLPMVLCVLDVRTVKAEGSSSSGQLAYTSALELTDGWYKIVAKIDQPLARAVGKKRIRRGVKLAIQGAKLESNGSGGTDVMQAFDKTCLSLTGNSTSLARWDERLGFRKRPYIATLRSLSPDGGVITCMEVVLVRLFPVAFVEAASTSSQQRAGTRGAAEEAEAQREWEDRYEDCRAKLAAKLEHDLKAIQNVQDLLASHAEDHAFSSSENGEYGHHDDGVFTQDYDSMTEDILDHLMASSTPGTALAERLRVVAKSEGTRRILINRLLSASSARSSAMQDEARSDLDVELNRVCPPRRVRSFRVCRFVDAATSARSAGGDTAGKLAQAGSSLSRTRKPCQRTVQLTVWDVAQLGEDMLVEGGKYRVTNLIPTQRSSWRAPDVQADAFLATRRDSTWKALS